MHKILLFLFVVFVSPLSHAYKLSDQDVILLQALFPNNNESTKTGLRAVHASSGISHVVFDFVAEKLASTDKEKLDTDTHAWFIKALSQSKSDKYDTIIKDSLIGRKTAKLLRHFQASQQHISVSSPKQYRKDELDVKALRSAVEARLISNRETRSLKYSDLFHLERCSPLKGVLERFGLPDSVGQFDLDSKRLSFAPNLSITFFVPDTHLQLNYQQFSSIVLTRDKQSNSWCLFNFTSSDIEPFLKPTNDEKIKEIRKLLWTHDHDTLVRAVKLARRKYKGDEAVLDELALRLWWGKFEKNSYIQAGLTHIAKVIVSSKSPRYWNAMNNVNNSALSKTVKAYTQKYLKKINKGTSIQFDAAMLVQSP